MIKKSPSGSACPYYYIGGELHPLKYGSFYNDKEKLFEIIKAEQDFILKASGQHNRRIWIDLYDTNVDDEVISALSEHIKTIEQKIFKLCLVGCKNPVKRKIIKAFKSNNIYIVYQMKFFDDPEEAKKWLVGEKI